MKGWAVCDRAVRAAEVLLALGLRLIRCRVDPLSRSTLGDA
jgi:hypothetical protein|tara:strand:- start:433 stop:555 length:123 start_codon:yes stop_codon:yes gene_type:complete